MSAALLSAISAGKQGLEALFFSSFSPSFPRCWPALGSAFSGETLPKLGQAAQKQMRSDTGAKEYSPEPPRAHITKVFDPEVTLLYEHPSCREGGMGNDVFLQTKVVNRDVGVRFQSLCPGCQNVLCLLFSPTSSIPISWSSWLLGGVNDIDALTGNLLLTS